MTTGKRSSKLTLSTDKFSLRELDSQSAFMEGDVLRGHMSLLVDAQERGKEVPKDTQTFFAEVFADFLHRDETELLDADLKTRRMALADALKLPSVGRGAPTIEAEDSAAFRRAMQVETIVSLAKDRDGKRVPVKVAVALVADHMTAAEDTVRTDRRRQAVNVKREFSGYRASHEDFFEPSRECGEMANRLVTLARDSDAIEPLSMSIRLGDAHSDQVTIAFPFERGLVRSSHLRGSSAWDLAFVLGMCAPVNDRARVYHHLAEKVKPRSLRDMGRELLASVDHSSENLSRGD